MSVVKLPAGAPEVPERLFSARSRRFPPPNPRSCSVEENQATESPKATPNRQSGSWKGPQPTKPSPGPQCGVSPLNQAHPLGVFLELPSGSDLRSPQEPLPSCHSACEKQLCGAAPQDHPPLPPSYTLPTPTLSLPSPQMSAVSFQELSRELREAVSWPGFQKTGERMGTKGTGKS